MDSREDIRSLLRNGKDITAPDATRIRMGVLGLIRSTLATDELIDAHDEFTALLNDLLHHRRRASPVVLSARIEAAVEALERVCAICDAEAVQPRRQ